MGAFRVTFITPAGIKWAVIVDGCEKEEAVEKAKKEGAAQFPNLDFSFDPKPQVRTL